jgi:hypothetical protein
MWIPLVLICTAQMCFTLGAPAIPTKKECDKAMHEIIIPYVREQAPQAAIRDAQCIQWGRQG